MANHSIIVGSMLGASEYVAEAIANELSNHGHTSQIHFEPDLTSIEQNSIWVICTSTHGAGELPDNIQNFAKQIQQADLHNVNFVLIGLGDSSYDTFCGGAKEIQRYCEASGAKIIHAPCLIDVLNHPIPEEFALEWLRTTYLSNGN